MSIVYFKQSWMIAQLDKWFKDEYINKKRPLNFYVNGTHTNDQIKMRPQIGVWDRLKAEPIRIVLKALDIAHEKGQLRTDLSKLKPYWGHDAIYDDYYTYCWVHFSVRDVRATVFLDNTIFQNVADHWMEALDEVRSGNNKGQANKGKGKGKGKSKKFDTPAGNYPFDYKLASVQDWRYDEHVNKRKEDEDSLDSWLDRPAKTPTGLKSAQNSHDVVSKFTSTYCRQDDGNLTLNSIPSLIGIGTDESVPPPNLHSTQNAISPCIVNNLPLLGIPPTRGEPARPRGAQAPLRRRRVYPHRAACKPRNRNRGFRSKSRTEGRKKERVERTKYKRRLFRQFKQFMLQYSFKQKALEMRKRSSTWRLFGKPERRRQFHHFSKREKNY